MNTKTVHKIYGVVKPERNYLTLDIVGKETTIKVPKIVAEYLNSDWVEGINSPLDILSNTVSQYPSRFVKNFFRYNNVLKFYDLVDFPNPFYGLKEDDNKKALKIINDINAMLFIFSMDMKTEHFLEIYCPTYYIDSNGKIIYDEGQKEMLEELRYYLKKFLNGVINKEAPLETLLNPFFLRALLKSIDIQY